MILGCDVIFFFFLIKLTNLLQIMSEKSAKRNKIVNALPDGSPLHQSKHRTDQRIKVRFIVSNQK